MQCRNSAIPTLTYSDVLRVNGCNDRVARLRGVYSVFYLTVAYYCLVCVNSSFFSSLAISKAVSSR